MLKIVLDTNVLISGIIVEAGLSGLILEAVQAGKLKLVISTALLVEFSEVITRPHIIKKYPKIAPHPDDLLDYLRVNAILVSGIPTSTVVKEDPDDDFVLASAIEGQADFIISGDPHLLHLDKDSGVPIMSPRQFVDSVLSGRD